MNTSQEKTLKKQIRVLIILFIFGLVISGITAFPIETLLHFLTDHSNQFPDSVSNWIHSVYIAINNTNLNYPYLAYGTDWLAFAHIVIAVAFIGPLKDPIRNIWVIEFGMIACLMVFPLAFIAGSIREIPLYWQFIDCSFGVIGFIPLYVSHKKIKHLEKLAVNKF